MGFDELRERFLRLRGDDIQPEEADRSIRRLGAQAARLYRANAEAGVHGFDLEFCQPQLKLGDEQGNERLWELTWRMITGVLSQRHPEYLPHAFGDGDVQPARAEQDADADVQIFTTNYPPERWRQRCEDNAAACALLARLVESHGTTPPPKGSKRIDDVKPHYDKDRRELSYGGECIKRLSQPAQNQEAVFLEFQDAGWPRRIEDPLGPGKIADTVRRLNKSQQHSGIRFRRDGTANGIIWEPAVSGPVEVERP